MADFSSLGFRTLDDAVPPARSANAVAPSYTSLGFATLDDLQPGQEEGQVDVGATLGDVGKGVAAGGSQLMGGVHSLLSRAATSPEEKQYQDLLARRSADNAGADTRDMTYSGRLASESPSLSRPIGSAAMFGASQVAPLGAIVAGGVLGGPAGAAGASAAITASQFAGDISQRIDEDPTLTETQKQQLRDKAITPGGLAVAAGAGAVMGGVVEGTGARALSRLWGAGKLASRAISAGESAVVQGGAAGSVAADEQMALVNSGVQPQVDAGAILRAGLTGAVIGGVAGAAHGAAHGSPRVYVKDAPISDATVAENFDAISKQGDAQKTSADEPAAGMPATDQIAALTKADVPATVAATLKSQVSTPETPETLRLQQQQALDPANTRKAVEFPKGTDILPLPEGLKQTKLFGSVYQYNPDQIKYNDLRVAVKDPVEKAKILAMGPVPKEEAITRAVTAGETPVAVTERTPSAAGGLGTEVKAAAGTSTTAPEQAAALESTKTPGNVVSVEHPDTVIAGREGVLGPAPPQPEGGVEPLVAGPAPVPGAVGRLMSPTLESGGPRILQDVSPQAKANVRAASAIVKANLKGPKAETEVGGANLNADEKPKRIADNAKADAIVAKYPVHPTEGDSPVITQKRAQAMVEDAKAQGIEIPKTFRPNADPEMNHGTSMQLLRAAQKLIEKEHPLKGEYTKFRSAETLLRAGVAKESEGRMLGGYDAAGDESGSAGRTESHEDEILDRIDSEREAAAQSSPPKELTVAERISKARAEGTPIMATLKSQPKIPPKIEIMKRRTIVRPAALDDLNETDYLHEAPALAKGGGEIETAGGQKVTPIESITAKDLLKRADFSYAKGPAKSLLPFLSRRLQSIVGDIPVHFISADDMARLDILGNGDRVGGFYDPVHDNIVMNELMTGPKLAHIGLHEAIHAATSQALDENPEFKALVARLSAEVKTVIPKESFSYAFTNEHEFIAEAMSNAPLQHWLAETKISEQLARDIGIPQFRSASFWSGIVNLVRTRIFRMAPSFTSALEGAMALTEQMTWKRDPAAALQFAARASAQERIRSVRASILDPREDATIKSQHMTDIGERLHGLLDSSKSMKDVFKTKVLPLFQGDQIARYFKHLWGTDDAHNSLQNIHDLTESMGVRRQENKVVGDTLSRDTSIAIRADPENGALFARLQREATENNLHPDQPLDSDANAHLRAPKNAKTDSDAAMRNWPGRSEHARLARDYNSLSPEFKELWQRTKDFYAKDAELRQRQSIEAIIGGHEPPKDSSIKEVMNRILNGDMTEEDQTHYDQFGVGKDLRDSTEFQRPQGFYAPAKRFGDYVTVGEHKLNVPANGRKFDENTVEFKGDNAREQAYQYQKSIDQASKASIKHYDPATGELSTKEKALSSALLPSDVRYHVKVERQNVQFHDTLDQAKAARQAMIDAKLEKVRGVMLRDQNPNLDLSLSSPQIQSLIKRIGRRTDVSDMQKNVMQKSLLESSIAMRRGERLEKSYIKRRDVAGASTDMVRTLNAYNQASASLRAQAEFGGRISDLLQKMKDHAEANQYDNNTLMRSAVIREVEARQYGFERPEFAGKLAPVLQKAMMFNFLKYLASPAHIALHATHPQMVTLPELAGRHGYFQTAREMYKAGRDMGGVMRAVAAGAKGMSDVFRHDTDATDFLGAYKERLGRARDGENINRMIDSLAERGIIHGAAGFDTSAYTESATAFQRGLSRVDRATRELTNAMEANNRIMDAVTAYRLEMKKTNDHDAAVRYAAEAVVKTNGLFSSTNTARAFRGPMIRALMQFRGYGMMMYNLLGRNLYNVFKGETTQIKGEALRSLAYTMGTVTATAGVFGGLPTEPLKLVTDLAYAFGLSKSNWQDVEDTGRQWLAKEFGPEAAEIISEGLFRILPYAPDVHHRMGYSALLTFGDPNSNKWSDSLEWAAQTVGGTPVGLVQSAVEGTQALMNGDLMKAAEKTLPFKELTDLMKGYTLATQGKVSAAGKQQLPPSIGAGVVQALGFSSAASANENAAAHALHTQTQYISNTRQSLLQAYGKASSGPAKAAALKAISSFNSAQPAQSRITESQKAAARAPKQTMLGQTLTPRNSAMVKDYSKAYNISP